MASDTAVDPDAIALPTDPLFQQQWYLLNTGQTGGTPGIDLNVTEVWQDYTGAGINVGILDDGVQYSHPDLDDNYNIDTDIDVDEADNDAYSGTDDFHGTAVAGIIAAEANNQIDGTGIAYNATINAIRMGFPPVFGPPDQEADALEAMVNFDVVNNSWGFGAFEDNFLQVYFQRHAAALQNAAQNGRNGLGTVVVFAGGNERAVGLSSNYNNLQNSRLTIAVAALNATGVHTYYSSPGANLLVSAFGGESSIGAADGIVTTDRLGTSGYNLSNAAASGTDYTDQFGGTSAAAPMVTGIVALMLEANPALGYRDVQTILAYSARQNDPDVTRWQINDATNWNGGGLHTSLDYGFGLVDARAAVRLAETWTDQQTYDNEQVVSEQSDRLQHIPDLGEAIDTIAVEQTLNLTHAEVSLSLFHTFPADLQIVLTSPQGTQSVLANQPQTGSQTLKFTFSSTQYWGETSSGSWTLQIRDRVGLDAGTLNSWTLRLYGDAPTADNTYIYTDEFAQVATDAARQTLHDLSGTDTINAAAITTASVLILAPGALSRLANQPLTIQSDSVI